MVAHSKDVAAVLAGMTTLLPKLEALYKDIHANPELSMQEARTAGIAAKRLEDAGFEVTPGIGKTGVVGLLHNGQGPTVMLRADMDALPIAENTGLAYSSTATARDAEGRDVPVGHMCGHDMHVAWLVGSATLLAQTRGFRALKIWMTMQQFGVHGYAAAIDANIALARELAERVRRADDFELMAPPSLSVVCFRYVDRSLRDENAVAALNRALLERLQLGGEAFITSTELGGRFVLRACIVNYRSTRDDLDRMLDAIRALARELGGSFSG